MEHLPYAKLCIRLSLHRRGIDTTLPHHGKHFQGQRRDLPTALHLLSLDDISKMDSVSISPIPRRFLLDSPL